ncbi:pyrroline-5-carboxylate reductase [Tissierella praeacuta]|uniref:Pyrroline-5-carboxylate reductase n=1 Tax=Tissierella praeacuta DSM 18095 TaxID=1123404 RepID=A0A1M4W615_9FIRM|nr:pyrroline-5-carboxylate reductase [Tissierella praeacuta]SHE76590.1 pyrroline-5-carboxylate reductase [Tissierella praeacuta DSM 18095]SUP00051.1 Pyrroline-5-carboxylate reductase [Tissierella praeacuta]
MDKTIGFIGCGNMAKAMLNGLIESKLISPQKIIVSAKTKETLEEVKKNYKVNVTLDNKKVARADYLILAVKPHMYDLILREIKEEISQECIVIIIAAGISIGYIKEHLGNAALVVKAMPNTPAMVREGVTALSFDEKIDEKTKVEIISIFNSFSRTEILEEELMDGFTALCGSSPAYVYMMIEAMGDGGVLQGIPRKQAYRMAAQAVLGAAKMVLDTDIHPGELKDNVCSPKGTTIEAVAKLEELGFRRSIIEAMRICGEKSKEMNK